MFNSPLEIAHEMDEIVKSNQLISRSFEYSEPRVKGNSDGNWLKNVRSARFLVFRLIRL